MFTNFLRRVSGNHRFLRFYSTNSRLVIGIRSEDKNCWERRCALAPEHVKQLIDDGVSVLVEPSNTRTFTNEEYERVGAKITKDLTPASTIVALKEVPIEKMIPEKTYLYFSHTIKAQPYNMDKLDATLQKNIRLIDYEKILDEKGRRVVKFGPYAGYCGTIDTLHMLGERLLIEFGMNTPLVNIAYSKNYLNLDEARRAIKLAGEKIQRVGLPLELKPLTFVVTGDGAVSKAIMTILNDLPSQYITVEELKDLTLHPEKADNHMIYICNTTSKDMVVPKKEFINEVPQPYSEPHYFENPQYYEPVFHETVMPYAKVIINGIYWDQKYPRLCSYEQARALIKENRFPLLALGDITCDPKGSLEFFEKATTITNPVYVVDVETGKCNDGSLLGKGVAILGIDHLPAEFPEFSSKNFGDGLVKFMKRVALSDDKLPFEQQELPPEIKTAVITSNGKLTPDFEYITELRKEKEKNIKKILLLGCGIVTPPVIDYLMNSDPNYKITVADYNETSAKKLAARHPERAVGKFLDVSNKDQLDELVGAHDVVLSLVPPPFHPIVAESCVRHKKHLLTASYTSDGIKALDSKAKEAGITIINEMGLDPGIDHMAIMDLFDKIHERDGRIISFSSLCGALPDPMASNNPLGYKFSWSPDGVLTAAQNEALFLWKGKEVVVPGEILVATAQPFDSYPGYKFQFYPNRNSLSYIDYYGVDKTYLKNWMRGTLRFPGFTNIYKAVCGVGLIDKTPLFERFANELQGKQSISWNGLMKCMFKVKTDSQLENAILQTLINRDLSLQEKYGNMNSFIKASLGKLSKRRINSDAKEAVEAMRTLGMLSSCEIIQLTEKTSTFSALSSLLQDKLKYNEGEVDLIMMVHEIIVEYPREKKTEKIISTLCLNGETGSYSATEKTVGYPIAIATDLLLKGKLPLEKLLGVSGPNRREIYEPVLKELAKQGIKLSEEVKEI